MPAHNKKGRRSARLLLKIEAELLEENRGLRQRNDFLQKRVGQLCGLLCLEVANRRGVHPRMLGVMP